MSGYLGPEPMQQFFDNTGVPCAGGLIYTFASGSDSTPLPIYSDAALAYPLTNPAILDAYGRLAYYIPTGVNYRFRLKTAALVTLWTQDDVEIPSITVPPSSGMPSGAVIGFGGTTTPDGYLPCTGNYYAIATYADLYAVCLTAFNTGGEPADTFRVPNLQGRFPLGKATSGTGATMGEAGGAIDHTHTVSGHTHTGPSHTHTVVVPSSTLQGIGTGTIANSGTLTSSASGTGTTGSTALTTNTANPPYLVIRYIIKT